MLFLGRWCRPLAIGLLLGLWVDVIWALYARFGLFRWPGMDFGLYHAQSAALQAGEASLMYRLDTIGRHLQTLLPYARPAGAPLQPGPVPYPPLFAWLFAPFTWPAPEVGFALWTALNLLAAMYLARQAATLFPASRRAWVALLTLGSFPVVYTLLVGQPLLLLAAAMGAVYRSFQAGREFRAGLWLACLLLKPQYGLLLAPLLLWKRRWSALAGASLGSLIWLAGSALVAGPAALLAYPTALMDAADFRGTGTIVFPQQMINWRALLLTAFPGITDQAGATLTAALGLLTVALLVPAWSGPWQPRGPDFAPRLTALLLATLLASYHSHVHGTALLIVPLAATLASGGASRLVRLSVLAGVFLPPLTFAMTGGIPPTALLYAVLLLVCLLGLAVPLYRARERSRVPAPQPG